MYGSNKIFRYSQLLLKIVVCLSWISFTEASQQSAGASPTLYLPPACNEAVAFSGFFNVTVISQEATNYSPNVNCTLQISMETVQDITYAINFTFTEISLQPKVNGECLDYVQFWDGGYENLGKAEYQLTDKICAQSLSELSLSQTQISGKEMKMLLLFRTDSSTESTGFKAEYQRLRTQSSSSSSANVLDDTRIVVVIVLLRLFQIINSFVMVIH